MKLLDLENRKELRRLAGKWRNLAVSRDGTTLALIGPKGLELRGLASGEVKVTLQGDFGCVAFSPDNRTLAVECDEGTEGLQKLHVRLLDVGTGRLKSSFKVESVEEGIMSLAFSPDGKTLAVGRYLDGLQLWDATTGKLKAHVPAAADPFPASSTGTRCTPFSDMIDETS